MLEGQTAGEDTRLQLDRRLTGRSRETTCPSGVNYHRLLDIGREHLETIQPCPLRQRLLKPLLRLTLPYPRRVAPLLTLGRGMAPLPARLRNKIPPRQRTDSWPQRSHRRTMRARGGCVQSAATAPTNIATARALDKLGITPLEADKAGCCGAMSQRFGATQEARIMMRCNIDAWWPHIDRGAEPTLLTASGCGAFVKECSKLHADDPT
jgi:glycolate oxidase iron-sulfur subunit